MRVSKRVVAFGVGLVAAGSVVVAHKASGYLTGSPELCNTCHADSPGLVDGVARSHPDVPCQGCHPTETSVGLALLRASSGLERDEMEHGVNVVLHGAASTERCADCHEREDPTWSRTAATTGHASHVGLEEPVGCHDCHAGEAAHDGRPGTEKCKECHDDRSVKSSPMAQVHCLECHDFLAPEAGRGRRPGWAECDRCHNLTGSARAMPVELHAEVPCAICHQPHREPFTVARGCEDCHPKVTHAHPEVEGTVYCTTCHGPHDEWSLAVERCAACHEEELLDALPAAAGAMALDAERCPSRRPTPPASSATPRTRARG